MKIKIIKKPFLAALAKAQKITVEKPIVPILVNSLFEFDGEDIKITSSDLATNLTQKVNGVCSPETPQLSVCMEPKSIYSYINQIEEDTIELEFNLEKSNVKISHKNGSITLPLEDSKDFPRVETKLEKCDFEIETIELCDAVAKLSKTAIVDTINPVFSSFFIDRDENGKVDMVQLHSTMANVLPINVSIFSDFETFGIYISGFKSIVSVLNASSIGMVLVHVRPSVVIFETESLMISTQRVDARLPDYRQIFNINFDSNAIISKESLRRSLKMALSINPGQGVGLDLEFYDKTCKLTISDLSSNSESTEQVELKEEVSAAFSIFINPKMIENGISVIDGDFVKIETNSNKPIKISEFANELGSNVYIGQMAKV